MSSSTNNMMDRRKYVRVRYTETVLCTKAYDSATNALVPLESPLAFTAVDISAAGIGAVSQYNIEAGAVLAVNCNIDNTDCEIIAKMAYCRKEGFDYRIGLEFVDLEDEMALKVKKYITKLSLIQGIK